MSRIQVAPVSASELREPLQLLEEWLREGEPVPDDFIRKLQHSVETGDVEVLAAYLGDRMVGALVLAFRPNISLGGLFASIEDLYIRPEARRRGVGGAILKAVEERCTERGVSYVEAQVEACGTDVFYSAFGYEPEPGVRVFSRSLVIGDRQNENPDSGLEKQ